MSVSDAVYFPPGKRVTEHRGLTVCTISVTAQDDIVCLVRPT